VCNLLFHGVYRTIKVAVAPQPAAAAAATALSDTTTSIATTNTAATATSEATAIESKPAAVAPAVVSAVTNDPAFEWVYMIYCGWVISSMISTVYSGVGAGQASTDVSNLDCHLHCYII
jgi:hypothetical protein